MNTLHFAYAVEVERCGSITQAAENLYMAQPNLSKAIKELEDTLGFAIFSRTSRGVFPTARGREFLVYARAVLAQVRKMEALNENHVDAVQRFSLIMPHSGYVAECFSLLIDSFSKDKAMDICIQEAGSLNAINAVADGQFQLAVIRWAASQKEVFIDYLREKGLTWQPVWEYDAQLLFSSNHPLAANEIIVPEELAPYPEMIYGDTALPHQPPRREETDMSHIVVFDRLMQFELLSHVPGAYMWTSPESETTLRRFGLVQRPCPESSPHFHDVLIYPAAYTLSQLDCRFMDLLDQAKIRLNSQSAQQNVF